MPWPEFAPEGEASAATYLEAIIAYCTARLLLLPPNPNNQFVQKWTAIHDAAAKDLANEAHGDLRDRVEETTGLAVNGDVENLESAWDDVVDCHTRITAPATTLAQLVLAFDSIEHMGGGGGDPRGAAVEPPDELPGWLGFRIKDGLPTLAAMLDGVEAAALGVVLRPRASAGAMSSCAPALAPIRAIRRLAGENATAASVADRRAVHAALRALNAALGRVEVPRAVVRAGVAKLRAATRRIR